MVMIIENFIQILMKSKRMRVGSVLNLLKNLPARLLKG